MPEFVPMLDSLAMHDPVVVQNACAHAVPTDGTLVMDYTKTVG